MSHIIHKPADCSYCGEESSVTPCYHWRPDGKAGYYYFTWNCKECGCRFNCECQQC